MDTTHTQFIASIILPLMLLICTAVYTVINYKMLKESKATRLQKITPNIVAYLSTPIFWEECVLHMISSTQKEYLQTL